MKNAFSDVEIIKNNKQKTRKNEQYSLARQTRK